MLPLFPLNCKMVTVGLEIRGKRVGDSWGKVLLEKYHKSRVRARGKGHFGTNHQNCGNMVTFGVFPSQWVIAWRPSGSGCERLHSINPGAWAPRPSGFAEAAGLSCPVGFDDFWTQGLSGFGDFGDFWPSGSGRGGGWGPSDRPVRVRRHREQFFIFSRIPDTTNPAGSVIPIDTTAHACVSIKKLWNKASLNP